MEHPLRRPELFACAWFGHVTPGATVDPLDARHERIARPTPDGRRFAQCLRCETWMVVDGPGPGEGVAIDSVDDLPRPRRGRELRQAIVVRAIAIDRAVHTVAFAAVGVAALAVRWRLSAIRGWAHDTLNALESARKGSGGASTHGFTAALLTRLAHIRAHSLLVLALLAGAYATVSAFECVGLWRERRWAEYLTVIATAGFLPLEVHELINRVTLVRVGAIVVNIAILVYLVVAKHLFGVGGPRPADTAGPIAALPELAPLTPADREP